MRKDLQLQPCENDPLLHRPPSPESTSGTVTGSNCARPPQTAIIVGASCRKLAGGSSISSADSGIPPTVGISFPSSSKKQLINIINLYAQNADYFLRLLFPQSQEHLHLEFYWRSQQYDSVRDIRGVCLRDPRVCSARGVEYLRAHDEA